MAYIKSNSEADSAVPEMWMAKALEHFRERIVALNLIRRDIQDDPQNAGDTININDLGALSAQDKSEGGSLTFQNPSNSDITVTLNNHTVVPWGLTDNTETLALDDAVDYIEKAVDTIIEEIESSILALYSNASSAVGAYGTDVSASTLTAARKALNENNVPNQDRAAIVSAKDGKALLDSDKVSDASFRDDDGEAFRNATLGRIYGFDTVESNLIAETSSGPVEYHGLAMHPDFAMLAMRPMQLPPEDTAQGSYVVDDKTGVILRFVKDYSHSDMAVTYSIDCLWGLSAIRPDFAVEVKG